MSLANYTELKASIADWFARDDLTSQIPDFITLGESRLNRRLRHKSMITSSTVTTSAVNKYVALPTGWLETISFTNDLGDPLEEVPFEELESLAYSAGEGRPEYYAISSRINFERVTGSALSYKMTHYTRLDIATDATNDILTYHPDCYLYSALLSAEPYLKNDDRLVMWADMLKAGIIEANQQSNRNRRELRTEFGGSGFNVIRGH